jgi:hypothetical protein
VGLPSPRFLKTRRCSAPVKPQLKNAALQTLVQTKTLHKNTQRHTGSQELLGVNPALLIDPIDNLAFRLVAANNLTQQLTHPVVIIALNRRQ